MNVKKIIIEIIIQREQNVFRQSYWTFDINCVFKTPKNCEKCIIEFILLKYNCINDMNDCILIEKASVNSVTLSIVLHFTRKNYSDSINCRNYSETLFRAILIFHHFIFYINRIQWLLQYEYVKRAFKTQWNNCSYIRLRPDANYSRAKSVCHVVIRVPETRETRTL